LPSIHPLQHLSTGSHIELTLGQARDSQIARNFVGVEVGETSPGLVEVLVGEARLPRSVRAGNDDDLLHGLGPTRII